MSLDSLKQQAEICSTSPQRLRELAGINDELARLVAANPVADCSLLEELAIKARNNKDAEVQRAIVLNPNTPTKWLIGLAYLFPEEFFSNPAYDLSILTNSNLVNLFPQKLLFKLTSASNAPTSFLEFSAGICETNIKQVCNHKYFKTFSLKHQYQIKYMEMNLGDTSRIYFEEFWKWREILVVIASKQNTSRKLLLDLSVSHDEVVAKIANLRLKYSRNEISFWEQVALNKNPNIITFIPRRLMFELAELPEISINFLKAASQLKTFPEILNVIANHPKTPKEVLNKLTENSIIFVAEAAKLHINYAEELATESCAQAASKIDRTQLPNLTNQEGIELRLWQAGAIHESTLPYLNQNSVCTDTNTLLKIVSSTDTLKTVLDNLENHHTSQLITDCIAYLKQREAIIFNLLPSTLPIDRTNLSTHVADRANPAIIDLDTLNLKLEDKYWRNKRRFIYIKEPARHVCLVDFFQTPIGSRSERSYLRQMLNNFDRGRYKEYPIIEVSNLEYYGVILASEPSTSSKILSILVEHPLQGVRVLVASHQNITQNSLNKLIDDRSLEVRATALANPKLNSVLKEQLASLDNPNLSSIDLLELANSEHTAVRTKVTRHQNVDGSILAKLADAKLIVRLAVAKHPKTPAAILTKLAEHPERKLPLAVAQNPGAPKDLLIKLATQPAVAGGFCLNPLNLAAVKSLLTQEPDAAIPWLERCLKFPEQPSFSRFLVLMNPHIPSSFLARYHKSWFWAERYAIAQNPNTDRDICQQLTQDPNIIVRAAARNNLNQCGDMPCLNDYC